MLILIATSFALAARSPESSLVGTPLWEVSSSDLSCSLPMAPAELESRLGVAHPRWDRVAGIDTIGTIDVHFGGGQIGLYDRDAYRHKLVNANQMPAGVQVALRRTATGFELDQWADDGTPLEPMRGIDRIELLPWEDSPEERHGYEWWRRYATHAAMLVEHGSLVTIVDTALWYSASTRWRTDEHWIEEVDLRPNSPITVVDTFDLAVLFPNGFTGARHSLTAVKKKMMNGMRWFLPTVLVQVPTGETTWLAFYPLGFWKPSLAGPSSLALFATVPHVCRVTPPAG